MALREYESLTKRGQVIRLRRLAENAILQFGVKDYDLKLVKHLVNTTFSLKWKDQRFLLRIHRVPDHSPERIVSELAWLDALSRDTDVVVQTPLKAPDRRMIVIAEAPGVPTPLPVSVLSWIQGKILRERNLSQFKSLGYLIAKLHSHASTWEPPSKPDRRTYDAEGIFGARAAYPLAPLADKDLPREFLGGLNEVYSRMQKVEHKLGRSQKQFGFIHFDLSFSNVLFHSNDARPIDFDECGFGYFLADIAVALAGSYGNEGFQERYQAVISGYREVRDISGDLLRYLPTFLAARSSIVALWSAHVGNREWRNQWERRLKLQLDERLFPVTWAI